MEVQKLNLRRRVARRDVDVLCELFGEVRYGTILMKSRYFSFGVQRWYLHLPVTLGPFLWCLDSCFWSHSYEGK